MAWLFLFAAIILEIVASIQLKLSEGFTKVDYSIYTVILFVLSFICAAVAFKKIDLSLAYAMWSGLGTVGIVAAGIFLFDEPSSVPQLACTALIVLGVVGLNIYS
ncbi:MAG: multidrug efflux SMR transporter [Candidatus Caenarcaniphilales bacterium]|jgi:multidrug transporter EmrE-like cation transporter|nr:multidrug efflux SMR transporter [Candidatus Caenarcaniphilales bacterium]